MIKELSTGKFALETIGAEDITEYNLINNYGLTFYIGNRKYDVRFWANCYGVALNEWKTSYCSTHNDMNGQNYDAPKDSIDRSICILIDYLFNTNNLDD